MTKRLLVFIGLVIFILHACTKINTTDLGADLIPNVDNVNTFADTLDIETYNRPSLDSEGVFFSDLQAVGKVADPVFGNVEAGALIQFKPTIMGQRSYRDTIIAIDSVVLGLTFAGVYGDSAAATPLSWDVYKLPAPDLFPFNKDSLYKTNAAIIQNAYNGSSTSITANGLPYSFSVGNFYDTKRISTTGKKADSGDVRGQLRIKLSTTFGRSILDSFATKRDSAFNNVFNGLLVKASGLPANTVAYLNLTDAKTNLTVYYRYRFAGVIDTTTTVYNIFKRQQVVAPTGDSIYGCATANYVKKSNRSALYTAYVNNAATALDSVLLVDAASEGAYIDARIPSLRGLSNRLVHRAELIITELPNQLSGRFVSPNLFLDVFDSTDNQLLFRPDFEFNNNGYNFGYFGGAHRLYNLQGENVYQYRFNMTRYLQNVVSRNGYIYKYFRVYAPFNMRGPTAGEFVSQLNYIANGRAVFAGGNHPNKKYKMMLRIIYSKI